MAKDNVSVYSADDEPGAYDNRLSLDPNDDRWPFVLTWEDGEEYELRVRVRQISPGEFEVLSAEETGGGAEEVEEYAERRRAQKPREESSARKPGGKGQPIPAILAVIGKNP